MSGPVPGLAPMRRSASCATNSTQNDIAGGWQIRPSYMNMNAEAPAKTARKRVLVVDDHAVVRTGLVTLINEEKDLMICGEADNEWGALEAVGRLHPDVAVVDWSLKNTDASDMVATMRRDHPQMPVLVLSIHDEVFYADRALRTGASGYVMKREAADRIVDAIRCVAAGRPYLSERAIMAITAGDNNRSDAGLATRTRSELTATKPASPATPVTRTTPVRTVPLKVSIVIPVFNGEATIEKLCHTLIRELSHSYVLQLVLVDDGSRDASAAIIQKIQEQHPEVVDGVLLARNFGEYHAVMAGLQCAEGDYCVIMDDDFQNPPGEVRNLVEEIQRGYDVVYTRYETMRHSWIRRLGSRMHNWTATHALGKPSDLYLSSFKIMSRLLVREIIHYTGPDPYLDAIILRSTRKIGVVTVRHEPRKHGRSGYTMRKLISLWGNIMVVFSLHPLRFVSALGLLLTLAGLAQSAYVVMALALAVLTDPDSHQKLYAVLTLLSGLTLFGVGVVGEYVGRIHKHLSNHPQYIVRKLLKRRPQN
jgi:DNA-binding NarL/FixJ family response regulator/glycosyltransferase involved in cell wall biosynthesis